MGWPLCKRIKIYLYLSVYLNRTLRMFRKPIMTKSRWSQFCLHIISLPVCLHWERKHSAMSLPADKFLVTSLRAEVPGNPESGTKKTFLETSWLHTSPLTEATGMQKTCKYKLSCNSTFWGADNQVWNSSSQFLQPNILRK